MNKATPSRPNAKSSSAADPEQPINLIEQHLSQARAIVDLVATVDQELVFDDTVSWALHAAVDHIDAAREAADRFSRKAYAHREE